MDEGRLDLDEDQGPDEIINISDVIEVIETDPDFGQSPTANSTMFNGGGEIIQPQKVLQSRPSGPNQTAGGHHQGKRPYVKIIEQPASKALRFRYECEGRSAGSIPGASSTPENKTFPSIQVVGYQGRAVVVVSCVTKDEPYRPHPHNLVGREGCKKGVCTMEISPETMCVTFSNLGIQCVKKKDIENALKVREEIKVDPFLTGFSHRNQPTSIDLNAVRLCFQVFLEGDKMGKFTIPLRPVVSEPIFDKKAMSDLIIVKLSHCVSYVDGGRDEIILLCEKVAKEDIQVRFYEEKDGHVVWEGFGDFQPSQVHKQAAISFRPPRYHILDITEPVRVFIQLRRPSDGASSEPRPFEFLPLDSGQNPYLTVPPMDVIKIEPRDKTPSPYGGQVYGALSPGYPQTQPVSPPMDNITFQQSPAAAVILPPISVMQQQNWNIPCTSTTTWPTSGGVGAAVAVGDLVDFGETAPTVNLDSDTGLSRFLDLDSQQLELKPVNITSGDLSMLDGNNLSDTFNHNLSLTDLNNDHIRDQSMTDSLTRLANSTLDKMCQS